MLDNNSDHNSSHRRDALYISPVVANARLLGHIHLLPPSGEPGETENIRTARQRRQRLERLCSTMTNLQCQKLLISLLSQGLDATFGNPRLTYEKQGTDLSLGLFLQRRPRAYSGTSSGEGEVLKSQVDRIGIVALDRGRKVYIKVEPSLDSVPELYEYRPEKHMLIRTGLMHNLLSLADKVA